MGIFYRDEDEYVDEKMTKRGRPKNDIIRDKTLKVRLTEEEYRCIKHASDGLDMSMAELLRRLFNKYYKDNY